MATEESVGEARDYMLVVKEVPLVVLVGTRNSAYAVWVAGKAALRCCHRSKSWRSLHLKQSTEVLVVDRPRKVAEDIVDGTRCAEAVVMRTFDRWC